MSYRIIACTHLCPEKIYIMSNHGGYVVKVIDKTLTLGEYGEMSDVMRWILMYSPSDILESVEGLIDKSGSEDIWGLRGYNCSHHL